MNQADEQFRETIFEAYELSEQLRALFDSVASDADSVPVPRSLISRVSVILPLVAGFALASLPIMRTVQRFETIARADHDACADALALVLDHVDYTNDACKPDELVSAVLPAEILIKVRGVLNGGKL
jgi:hypothetical protein